MGYREHKKQQEKKVLSVHVFWVPNYNRGQIFFHIFKFHYYKFIVYNYGFIIFLFKNLLITIKYVLNVWGRTHATEPMWWSEDNFVEHVLSFTCM